MRKREGESNWRRKDCLLLLPFRYCVFVCEIYFSCLEQHQLSLSRSLPLIISLAYNGSIHDKALRPVWQFIVYSGINLFHEPYSPRGWTPSTDLFSRASCFASFVQSLSSLLVINAIRASEKHVFQTFSFYSHLESETWRHRKMKKAGKRERDVIKIVVEWKKAPEGREARKWDKSISTLYSLGFFFHSPPFCVYVARRNKCELQWNGFQNTLSFARITAPVFN